MDTSASQKCIIIGASHAGVNTAFSLRKEGWQGDICLIDSDPTLPYHRPPLSKAYLTSANATDSNAINSNCIKSQESYDKENITLELGKKVLELNSKEQTVTLDDGSSLAYDKLVMTTGASAIVPPIQGLADAKQVFTLRTAQDVEQIRKAMDSTKAAKANPQVVIIGGGYIGLETAASMKKLGANVTVLERESRILARVTAPEMSAFFQQLHADNDVDVLTGKNVTEIVTSATPESAEQSVVCSDGEQYPADIIIIGVGVRVNTELAVQAELAIENGIKVNEYGQSSNANIYSVGDCTFHHNPHYDRFIRLESVQNAVDQAKVAAASLCGKDKVYDTIPWFWSDQYDVKLQMVGLSQGYDNVVKRVEEGESNKFSVWYFKGDQLLSVDAVNNAKAYVIGTKFIKTNTLVDKQKLADASVEFKPANLTK